MRDALTQLPSSGQSHLIRADRKFGYQPELVPYLGGSDDLFE
jgi:hypothetical protein